MNTRKRGTLIFQGFCFLKVNIRNRSTLLIKGLLGKLVSGHVEHGHEWRGQNEVRG